MTVIGSSSVVRVGGCSAFQEPDRDDSLISIALFDATKRISHTKPTGQIERLDNEDDSHSSGCDL
jgi:hypothetical protein